MINGMPMNGRIAIQTIPITNIEQAQAGGHETTVIIACIISPKKGPMQGMQSAMTSMGPKRQQNADHAIINPINLNNHVVATFVAFSSSKNLSLVILPFLRLPNVVPLQSHESGAVHFPKVPSEFLPSTVTSGFSQLFPKNLILYAPIVSALGDFD